MSPFDSWVLSCKITNTSSALTIFRKKLTWHKLCIVNLPYSVLLKRDPLKKPLNEVLCFPLLLSSCYCRCVYTWDSSLIRDPVSQLDLFFSSCISAQLLLFLLCFVPTCTNSFSSRVLAHSSFPWFSVLYLHVVRDSKCFNLYGIPWSHKFYNLHSLK